MEYQLDSDHKDLQDIGYPFEETDGLEQDPSVSVEDCCALGSVALSEVVHGPHLSPYAQEMYDKLDDGRDSTRRSHTRRAALAYARGQITESEFKILDTKLSRTTSKPKKPWSPSDVLSTLDKQSEPDARQRQMKDY